LYKGEVMWEGMVDASRLYMTTEWFGKNDWMDHNAKVEYEKGQRVEEIVNDWRQTWQPMWLPSELAYGVIKAQDNVKDDEWPDHTSRELRWAVTKEKPWRREMTVEELFDGVNLRPNERFFLVISKLDLKTVHSGEGVEEQVARENVAKAVGWLWGLYLDVTGMLRQLKRLGK
jgi:hypothetical protein